LQEFLAVFKHLVIGAGVPHEAVWGGLKDCGSETV